MEWTAMQDKKSGRAGINKKKKKRYGEEMNDRLGQTVPSCSSPLIANENEPG